MLTTDELNDINMAAVILDDPRKFQLGTLELCASRLRALARKVEDSRDEQPDLQQNIIDLAESNPVIAAYLQHWRDGMPWKVALSHMVVALAEHNKALLELAEGRLSTKAPTIQVSINDLPPELRDKLTGIVGE